MLKVHTTNGPNVAVLCVQGRIVRGETEVLRNAVLAQREVSLVVLDLARVSMIDAGGLSLLLELREYTESSGIEFRLKNVTKLVRQVLEITRLDTVFDISMGKDVPVAPLHQRPGFWLRHKLLRKREGVKGTA
jgi:anti-sigma B factor antagonist